MPWIILRLRVDLAALHFQAPSVPVVTNVEAKPNTDSSRMAQLLYEQVTAPVRFTEMAKFLVDAGVTAFLEVGAGRVLSSLLARIERRSQRARFGGLEDLEGVQEFLQKS